MSINPPDRTEEPPTWSMGASSFRSVPDMWAHRVGSTPDSTAMIYRRAGRWTSITWREAGIRVRAIAEALLADELQPETRCVILAETSVEWILCDLAILCAGGATTTVYPTSTAEELAYIVADCEARVVFCDTEAQVEKLRTVQDRLPSLRRIVVLFGHSSADGWVTSLSDFEREGRSWGTKHPDAYETARAAVGPDHLATLMYTSGTTGEPKGVMLTHDAWIYEAEAIDALGFLNPADKHYLFLPLAHVFAKVMEVSFIRLGVVSVVDASSSELLDNLAATQPTTMAAVPRVFEKIYNRVLQGVATRGPAARATFHWALRIGREVSALRQRGQKPSGTLLARFAIADRLVFRRIKALFGGRMRFMISGGAPLAREIAEFFHACDVLILEGYGLTESSAASCVNRLDSYRFGAVGPPLPGCEVKVAADGEILLRSRGVMKGYYRRPEDTEAALDADGWLRTGDIGMVQDGHVRITGRKKDIIVTAGGKNIAPAHFQGMLASRCPYVSEVLLHGDRRPFCVALIAIEFEPTAAWARDHQVSFTNYSDLASSAEVLDLLQGYVDMVNRELPPFEQAKRIALLPEDLTQENGALTATLKLKRAVVEARYADILDGFYEARPSWGDG